MIDSSHFPSSAPELAASRTYAELDEVMARARGRQTLIGVLVGVGVAFSLSSVVIVGAAALLGTLPSVAIRFGGLAMLWAVVIVPLVVVGFNAGRRDDGRLSIRLTSGDLRLRSMLLSAIELRALTEETSGVSRGLVQAQAALATERLQSLDLRKALPARSAALALGVGLMSLVATGMLWRFGPETLRRGFSGLWRLPIPATPGEQREPITGDIELTYLYPVHTHLPTRVVVGTSGEIDAPVGTEVQLKTRADRVTKEAGVVVNGVAYALSVVDERMLSGGFKVTKAGHYYFRFGPAQKPTVEGPPLAISVQVDAPPRISLDAPREQLETQSDQVLGLRYQASDDYGLSEVRLVYRLPGAEKEQSDVLRKYADPPARLDGTARFDLAPLHLMPGDEVTYALEALDNDDVQGPKVGRSRPHVLKIFSEEEHHREALARARALWERLLALLGDRLGEPQDASRDPVGMSIDQRALELCGDLDRESTRLLKDKAQERSLAIALSNVARSERRRASETMDAHDLLRPVSYSTRSSQPAGLAITIRRSLTGEIEGLERDVLYLEALLDQATSQDLLSLSRELASRRRELAELLERYRKNPTPELKAQVTALLNRLKARTAELMARAQELAKGYSNQHLNREAQAALLKDKDIGGDLAKAQDALASGDVDGALKSLDQLASALDGIQKQLTRSQQEQAQPYPELTKKLADFKQQLEDVQRQETKITEDTEKLRQEARKSLERRAPAAPTLLDKLRAEAARAQAEIEQIPDTTFPRGMLVEDSLPEAKERARDLSRALQSNDLAQAVHSVEQTLRAVGLLRGQADRDGLYRSLGGLVGTSDDPPVPSEQLGEAKAHLGQADPLLRSVRDQLQKLFPDEKSLLTPKQRQQLSQLQQAQNRAREGAKRLEQKLEQVTSEAPVFDPSAKDSLQEAGERMQQAGQKLGSEEPGGASQDEHGALDQLNRLSQAMRGGRGSSAGGIPNPFAMGQPGGDGDSSGSPEMAEHDKVVVPGADQYQVPAEFRSDILDAMKQKAPKSYEDEVKHYYQEIVK